MRITIAILLIKILIQHPRQPRPNDFLLTRVANHLISVSTSRKFIFILFVVMGALVGVLAQMYFKVGVIK
jgi:hypothetical protein